MLLPNTQKQNLLLHTIAHEHMLNFIQMKICLPSYILLPLLQQLILLVFFLCWLSVLHYLTSMYFVCIVIIDTTNYFWQNQLVELLIFYYVWLPSDCIFWSVRGDWWLTWYVMTNLKRTKKLNFDWSGLNTLKFIGNSWSSKISITSWLLIGRLTEKK